MANDTETNIVQLELGFDRFEAQVIAASCEAEGLSVEALFMDEMGNAPGLTALEPHQLLVRSEEAEQAQRIIATSRG